LPVGSNRTPTLAEAFFVGVAVLRDDGSYALRVADGEPEACRRAVVKDVHCKPIEAEDLGKAVDHAGNVVERVGELFPRRHVGLAEAGQVRGYDMEAVRQERDQVAEHVARAWEPMQQQELWRAGRSSLAVKYLKTVHVGSPILNSGHGVSPLSNP
jgi:hypothetical protein